MPRSLNTSTPLILILLFTSMAGMITATAQTREPAFLMNERLGRGINIGNTFEAPSETEWGNPWKPEYFKIISELGFDHVRVPVRWEPAERSMSTAPYTISPDFLARIRDVIETALHYKLHIIINMHHHEALFADPVGQKDRFIAQWQQIGDYFKDYSDSLLFEVLNEPHGNLTPELWNDYFAGALAAIRTKNPTRVVLMGIADYGGLGGVSKLEIPADDYIILSPHYYNPFPFTHQGAEWVDGANAWLGTLWRDTEAERDAVASEFNYILELSESEHIPVHVGEFGAYSKADMSSRVLWTTFLARWFEEHGMSWAYWEFNSGFGIYNPTTKEYMDPLIDALLVNRMPEPTPIFATPVYISNFSSGADGWALFQQSGASGSLSVTNAKLHAEITSGGTEGWHLQLVKNNIALEKGKFYRLSFTARASASRALSFYAGRASSPWDAYSGFNSVSVNTAEADYSFTFTMTSETDRSARLVFDLGTQTAAVTLSDIRVEEITFEQVTAISRDEPEGAPSVYPNPFSSHFTLDNTAPYRSVKLFDMSGRCIFTITPGQQTIDTRHLPPGRYILLLQGAKKINAASLIKKR